MVLSGAEPTSTWSFWSFCSIAITWLFQSAYHRLPVFLGPHVLNAVKKRKADLCRRPVGVHREDRGDLALDALREKCHRLRVERRHKMLLLYDLAIIAYRDGHPDAVRGEFLYRGIKDVIFPLKEG